MTQSKALSNRQIARAALIVLFGFVASGVLGLIRTSIISATFGTSDALDAFYAAQRIPETIFVLVAGGALGSAFIPVFSRYLSREDGEDDAWRLASAVTTLITLIATLLAIIVVLLADRLVPLLLVPNAPPDVQNLTVSLTRLMLITPVIFSISGLMMGILNTHQRFVLAALAPAMNNIGLIIGAIIITRIISVDESLAQVGSANVYGLAWGTILGAVLHLAIQLPGLISLRGRLRLLPNWRVPGVREVLLLMGPRVLGLAVVQINFAVNVALSSGMVSGSYTALNTAWFLLFFSLGVIAQSVGTAVFPSLSTLAAENDMAGYKDRLAGAMRNVLFLSFPATVAMIIFGEPVIGLLFERGEWSAESTAATAWALQFFALGIVGHSLLEVLSRAFYALSDTRTPVTIGVIAMVANIILSVIFIRIIGDSNSLIHGSFAGLALANSLTTLWEGAILWWLLRRRIGDLNDAYVRDGVWRALLAAAGMGIVGWIIVAALNDAGYLLTALIGGGTAVAVFFAMSLALGIDEARSVPRVLLRRGRG